MGADIGPTVYAVDNDPPAMNLLRDVAERMNLQCRTFTSGLEFLDVIDRDKPGCAVLAVRIADISGPQIQRRLLAEAIDIPVIFLVAHVSISIVVRVMREGAISVLEKPLVEQDLWDTLQEAVRVDGRRRQDRACEERLKSRFKSLTEKEHQVLELLLEAKPLKRIAETLGISVRAVELRRNNLMEKLAARSFVELIQIATSAGNGFHRPEDCRVCAVPACPRRLTGSRGTGVPALDRRETGTIPGGLD